MEKTKMSQKQAMEIAITELDKVEFADKKMVIEKLQSCIQSINKKNSTAKTKATKDQEQVDQFIMNRLAELNEPTGIKQLAVDSCEVGLCFSIQKVVAGVKRLHSADKVVRNYDDKGNLTISLA